MSLRSGEGYQDAGELREGLWPSKSTYQDGDTHHRMIWNDDHKIRVQGPHLGLGRNILDVTEKSKRTKGATLREGKAMQQPADTAWRA